MQTVARGEVGVRANRLTGSVSEWRDGSVLVVARPARDARATRCATGATGRRRSRRADGPAPLQSVEGLSLGVDLTVRYALDPARLAPCRRSLPDDIGGEIVEPAVQGVIYKMFARYTVREIFSTKRVEIQQAIESELGTRLAADGIVLRGVHDGQGGPAGRLPARHGRAAGRGAGDRRRCATRWS